MQSLNNFRELIGVKVNASDSRIENSITTPKHSFFYFLGRYWSCCEGKYRKKTLIDPWENVRMLDFKFTFEQFEKPWEALKINDSSYNDIAYCTQQRTLSIQSIILLSHDTHIMLFCTISV